MLTDMIVIESDDIPVRALSTHDAIPTIPRSTSDSQHHHYQYNGCGDCEPDSETKGCQQPIDHWQRDEIFKLSFAYSVLKSRFMWSRLFI